MTPEQKAKQMEEILIKKGKLVEGGWQGLRMMAYGRVTDLQQLKDMRQIFFAGAHHLFNSILSVLDPVEEPTKEDVDILSMIQKELNEFFNDFYHSNVVKQTGGKQ